MSALTRNPSEHDEEPKSKEVRTLNEPPEDYRRTREWYKQLHSLQSVGEHELQLFAWYLEESEAVLRRMQAEEVEYIRRQVAAGLEDVNDSGLLATGYQLRRIRYSHIIYLASMLESVLKRECDRLALALGPQGAPISAAEIRGDQWSSKKTFLERFGHFEISDTIWSPTKHLTRVRNILVHDNGAVSSTELGRLRGIAGITVVSGEVEVDVSFVTDSFNSVRNLADFLNKHVAEVIARRLRPRNLA